MGHLISSPAQFSLICQFLRYFFKKYVGRHVIFLILCIYIYKIEIRNSESYLPEVVGDLIYVPIFFLFHQLNLQTFN